MLSPHTDCPVSPCVRLLAGSWTLEILYYLRQSPYRFGDLRRILQGVSSKVLTTRLRQLEERGVISRRIVEGNPPGTEYCLTELGEELSPILDMLSVVSERIQAFYRRGEDHRMGE